MVCGRNVVSAAGEGVRWGRLGVCGSQRPPAPPPTLPCLPSAQPTLSYLSTRPSTLLCLSVCVCVSYLAFTHLACLLHYLALPTWSCLPTHHALTLSPACLPACLFSPIPTICVNHIVSCKRHSPCHAIYSIPSSLLFLTPHILCVLEYHIILYSVF